MPRPGTILKTTASRCPVCIGEVPATVTRRDDGIWMEKRCPAHGDFEVRLSGDPRWWFPSRGARADSACGGACGCGPSGDRTGAPAAGSGAGAGDPFDRLSTCVALIEIVETCNLTCPTCYAASPFGTGEEVRAVSLERFVERVEGVLRRKGSIDILQLSGGEPTIHPRFLDLLDWCLDEPRIGYVLVNTNGVRIATDAGFRGALGERRRARKRFELYLQFDGPQEAGQRALRGADLRQVRERAVDEAGALGVPTTLAMVVNAETLPFVGDALRWGVSRPHCRGITFQPVFTSGRIPATALTVEGAAAGAAVVQPLGVGDVVEALVAQAPEMLIGPEDFTPLPCGDPNCHTIGYLLRLPEGPVPLGQLVDLASLQGFLADRVDYRVEDLARCGCETEPLGAALRSIELSPELPFRIFIKPFMDAWTFDQDRIDRCCTHVVREDGSLDSFCRHYLAAGRIGAA